MKKLLIAAAVIALVAAMCIPITVFSEDSAAASTVTPGSSGVSAEITLEDENEIFKFVDKDDLPDMAAMYLGRIVVSPAQYDISDVKILKLEYKGSLGTEVNEEDYTNLNGYYTLMKVTFTATAKEGATGILFDGDYGNLIEYVDTDNVNRAGAVFKIEMTLEITDSEEDYWEFVKNADNNLVITKYTNEYNYVEKMDYSVEYTYKDTNGKDVNKEFDFSFTSEDAAKSTIEYELIGIEARDAVAESKVFIKGDYDYSHDYRQTKVKCDGETYTWKHVYAYDENDFSTYDTAEIWVDANLSAPEYLFYGPDPALFHIYQVVDESLRSNDALKAYLDENGSIGTDFKAAKSVAEDTFDAPAKKKSNVGLYIGIGVAVAAAAAIVAVIIIRRRR